MADASREINNIVVLLGPTNHSIRVAILPADLSLQVGSSLGGSDVVAVIVASCASLSQTRRLAGRVQKFISGADQREETRRDAAAVRAEVHCFALGSSSSSERREKGRPGDRLYD